MSIRDFAKHELELAGLFDKDSDYGGMLGEAVMKMIDQFAEEGHSGASAAMAISLFEKVARFKPLTPLTGEPDEWVEVVDGEMWQNRRCPHVFKNSADGEAYDSNGKVFVEPDGCSYTSRDSRVPITFPYWPKIEYVHVPRSDDASSKQDGSGTGPERSEGTNNTPEATGKEITP